MIILDSTSHTLRCVTSTAGILDYYNSYADITTSAFTPAESMGSISSATTTTAVSAPGASTQRQLKYAAYTNRGNTTMTFYFAVWDGSNARAITPTVSLLPGESYQYNDGHGWREFDSSGREKSNNVIQNGVNGFAASLHKVGTAPEAAGNWYCWSKDSGFPGAWSVGTSGVAGRATDGTTSTDAGCLVIANPSTGSNYLAQMNIATSVVCNFQLFDVVWVNNGLTVTTTTAQTVNSVAFPARDANGSSNGVGFQVGILVTTATTNVGAITNTTLTYTNQDNTGSRTATMATFPATANIGTFMPFQLQAGDTGIRSIQSVTLGTSYGGGAISLIVYRVISGQPCVIANAGTPDGIPANIPGVKLYNGVCALPFGLMTSTTATNVAGTFQIMER